MDGEKKNGIEAAQDKEASDAKEELFNFAEALYILKEGKKMTRKGWNGKGMYVEAQFPDANSKMERPYIFIVPGEGFTVPWVASQADLFAEDWMLVQ